MIKPIMKDEAFLAIKSVPATKMDTQVNITDGQAHPIR